MSQNPIRISELPLISPLASDQIPLARGSGSTGQTFKTNLNWLISYTLQAQPSDTVNLTLDPTTLSLSADVNLNSIKNEHLHIMPPNSIKANVDPTTSLNPVDITSAPNTVLLRQNGSLMFKGGNADQILRIDSTGTLLDFGALNLNSSSSVVGSLLPKHGGASPFDVNVRMSLNPTSPISLSDRIGTNANTLYIHPYKGNILPLYDLTSGAWTFDAVTGIISHPLNGTSPNSNYDVFVYKSNTGAFAVELVPWINSNAGSAVSSNKTNVQGILVKTGEPNKRYLGCLRTVNSGQSEQSFGGIAVSGGANSKQFLWNCYNKVEAVCSSFDNDVYYHTINSGAGTGWVRVNSTHASGGNNNRVSFITGDDSLIKATGRIYPVDANTSQQNLLTHVGLGVNSNISIDTTGNQMIGSASSINQTPTAFLTKTFSQGFNYIQLFEKIEQNTGSSMSITMNDGSAQHTGIMLTMLN